jgi:hypothetical protein
MNTYYSDRRHPLVFCGVSEEFPVVTVENYVKWYEPWLVLPDGSVRKVTFEKMESHAVALDTSAMGDHVFNPAVIERMALENGWLVDETSMDMIVGRWVREHQGVDVSSFAGSPSQTHCSTRSRPHSGASWRRC